MPSGPGDLLSRVVWSSEIKYFVGSIVRINALPHRVLERRYNRRRAVYEHTVSRI